MLAESWMDTPVRQDAGMRYQVLSGGWLELEAYGTASVAVAVWPAVSVWPSVALALRRGLRGFRRVFSV